MNDTISPPLDLLDDPATRAEDAQAVWEKFRTGQPLDPSVAARVRARSEKITAETFRKFGYLDVAVDLVREGRDEE